MCFIQQNLQDVQALENYYIIETNIQIEDVLETRANTTKTASKTLKIKNKADKVIWQVKVTGTFSYNGKTSTCQKSNVTTKVYSSDWKILSQSSSKNKNTATATAKAGLYRNGILKDTLTKNVSITCDKNENMK